MDDGAVTAWLERYVAAWRSYDPDEIGALFSEDATYRFHPWDSDADAVHGRTAIVADWLESRDEPGSWEASYRPWITAADRAVAVGT